MQIKSITNSLRALGLFFIFGFTLFGILSTGISLKDVNSEFLFNFFSLTSTLEEKFFDYRLKSTIDPNFKSKEIVLLAVDDYSLQKIGTWPIKRSIHAQMIDKLNTFGAKVVALDIFFPEKSLDPSADKALASAITNFQKDNKRVYIAYTLVEKAESALPEAPMEMYDDLISTQISENLWPMKIDKYTFPIQEILDSGTGLGNIHAEPDFDGIFRKYILISNISDIYFGSLALNAFQSFTNNKVKVKVFKNSSEINFDGKVLETLGRGETKIRYVGDINNFPTVPLYDLISAKENDPKMKEIFENKMVFVGSTATGAHDLRPSPVDSEMPGVFSHMNMAHMLIHQHFFKSTVESIQATLIILFISMLLFFFVQKMGNAFLDATVVAISLIATYYADINYFLPNGYELKLAFAFGCLIFSYSWNTFIKFYEANKEKKQIKGTFARYVAPTVVDEMLKDPDNLHVGGTKMDITCLFSDVRDFTKISEGMTATELAQSLNTYMGAMTDIVFDTKGTLDKYIGDAIVALWGAPLQIGNHAQFAVEAAIKMINVLPSINEEFTKLGRPIFNIGVGLNSGECSVGNMGSDRIFSYTALGDNMNLGARLESLCKHYGTQILISEMTKERLDLTNIKLRPIDKVVVKGKTKAVQIFEVLHENHWLTKNSDAHELYLNAFNEFNEKNFEKSSSLFKELVKMNSEDKPTLRVLDLCEKYIASPELANEDFDVTIMKEK